MSAPDESFDTRWTTAWELRRTDAVAAIAHAEQLREELDTADVVEDEQRARLVLLEGSCRWRLSAYGDALRCLTEALELLPSVRRAERAAAHQDLGTVHIYLGQHDEAVAQLLDALELRELIDDEQGRSDVENNLGIVFYHRGDLHEAERAYRAALGRRQRLGDIDGVAAARNNLAKVLTDRGRYAEARDQLERARDAWAGLGNHRGLAMAITNLGIVHRDEDDLNAAAARFEEALAIKREIADVLGACETATHLGRVRSRQRRTDEALDLLHRAAADAERLGVTSELAEACLALADVHERFGDHVGALAWFRRYHDADRRRFDERSTERLHALQVSYQLARAEHEGATDELTGLCNRRAFDRETTELLRNARRDDRLLSVALLDLDDFKQVNDRFGHPVGDEVLRRIAEVLRTHTRAADVACRYGGEEFAVALPDTELADAVRAADQLRRRVRAIDWSEVHHELAVTTSIGVATAAHGDDLAELLARADRELYRAKHQGKDRVLS
jgi:diguanylate cyclase (GGDEF)-like protein